MEVATICANITTPLPLDPYNQQFKTDMQKMHQEEPISERSSERGSETNLSAPLSNGVAMFYEQQSETVKAAVSVQSNSLSETELQ